MENTTHSDNNATVDRRVRVEGNTPVERNQNIDNNALEMRKNLYMKDVERLLRRPVDGVEKTAINIAFGRHWSSLETAKVITGANDRVDRQNDFA